MNARLTLLTLGALAAAAAGLASAASAASPDLTANITAAPAVAGHALVVGEEIRPVATVWNLGLGDAGPFEVDIVVDDTQGGVVLGGHSINVTGLAAGASVTLNDTMVFVRALDGSVRLSITVDPANRTNDSLAGNNHNATTLYVGPPPVTAMEEAYAGKVSATRTLPPYSYLAFKLDLRDGDSVIFQANATGGDLFDCYLMTDADFAEYKEAREVPALNGSVRYVRDYSHTATDRIQYTADPLPPGTYYLVIENDVRLQSGAPVKGPVTVEYALAVVNSSLPTWSAALVIAGAAAAIYATVRWRPHFDVRSPLLEVPPPEPEEPEPADDSPEDEEPVGGAHGDPPDSPSALPEDEAEGGGATA